MAPAYKQRRLAREKRQQQLPETRAQREAQERRRYETERALRVAKEEIQMLRHDKRVLTEALHGRASA